MVDAATGRQVRLSVMTEDIKAHVHPDVSIVDDLEAVYERARAAGAEIVHPLTHEDWGLTRFFLRDPNGAVINVTQRDERRVSRSASRGK